VQSPQQPDAPRAAQDVRHPRCTARDGAHAWSACSRFVLASLALLGASRVLLVALHARRVSDKNGFAEVLLGGLRIDLSLVAVLVAGPLLLAPWFGGAQRGARLYQRAQAVYFACALLLIGFLEAATPAFIAEYGFRPNRLFFEYLGSPRELLATLWSAYRVPLLASLAAGVAAIWIARALFRVRPARALRWWLRAPASALACGLCLLAARSGFQHRPINPASVAFCDDPLLNSLALNSLYNVGFALYRLKDEADASLVYGRMPLDEMHARVRAAAGLSGAAADAQRPSVHHQVPALQRTRPVHLVVIVEESLGARYVGELGGADLTPELDALAAQSWWFERMYATGTRSARGLEAISAGFLPSPARAVLKLDRAQGGFFTLAALLREHGYHARFVYGGEGQFDNMQGFFLANGFHEAIDGGDFENPRFVGSWGVSDEDVLERVHRELLADGERPSFTLAFSVSNHTPYDYPSGRIERGDGPAATQDNAIRYADWALGDFFAKARAAPYWEHTIFAVIADHDSRVYGADLVPLERFHIPALILGPDVPVRRDARLASQIDLGPTLLSLLGLDCAHPMLGRDLLSLPDTEPGRALMQYEENHAYWSGTRVVIHQPHKPAQQFRTDGVQLVPMELDVDFARTALAHALWASWAYREQRYGLPPQPTARVARR
jgi:phosphoglycerol transferase MdoB-like AlkP superfamily enzyme